MADTNRESPTAHSPTQGEGAISGQPANADTTEKGNKFEFLWKIKDWVFSRVGWIFIAAGFVFILNKSFHLKRMMTFGVALAILGLLIVSGSIAEGIKEFINASKKTKREQAIGSLLMIASVVGPLLVVFGLIVIVLDIIGPDFLEAISTWDYALPLIGGIALIFFAPAIETFERISAKKGGAQTCPTNKGGEEARASD
jgi:hypothetical protein